jgi:hypothetical protein
MEEIVLIQKLRKKVFCEVNARAPSRVPLDKWLVEGTLHGAGKTDPASTLIRPVR